MRYDMIDDPRWQDLNPTEKLVCMQIDWFDGDGNGCWRSREQLAYAAGISPRQLQRTLKVLTDVGLLETTAKGKGYNRRILTDVHYRDRGDTHVSGDTHDSLEETLVTPQGDTDDSLEETLMTPTVNTHLTNSKHNKKQEAQQILDLLTDVVSLESAQDFIEHRKGMKRPVTVLAATRIANQLRKYDDPDACIDQAIAQGWIGVHPLKKEAGEKREGNLQSRLMEELYADRAAEAEHNQLTCGQGTLGADYAQTDYQQRAGELPAVRHIRAVK